MANSLGLVKDTFYVNTNLPCDDKNCINGSKVVGIKIISEKEKTGDVTENTLIITNVIPVSTLSSIEAKTQYQLEQAVKNKKTIFVDSKDATVRIFDKFPEVIYSPESNTGIIVNKHILSKTSLLSSQDHQLSSNTIWFVVGAVITFVLIIILVVVLIVHHKK